MKLAQIPNLLGLLLITFGGIGAALGTPSPKYNADGSVSLSGEPDKKTRIAMHRQQLWFPKFLLLVGVGALLQAIALFV